MVNLIWVCLTVIGLVFAMFNGTLQDVNEAVFKGAKEAVTISFGLMSVLVFWLGLMKIAEQSGLLDIFSRMCRPFISKLFPDIPPDHPAMGYILSNLMANFFGLGNAATPLGIKAMEQMKKLNGGKSEASRSMITFFGGKYFEYYIDTDNRHCRAHGLLGEITDRYRRADHLSDFNFGNRRDFH